MTGGTDIRGWKNTNTSVKTVIYNLEDKKCTKFEALGEELGKQNFTIMVTIGCICQGKKKKKSGMGLRVMENSELGSLSQSAFQRTLPSLSRGPSNSPQ